MGTISDMHSAHSLDGYTASAKVSLLGFVVDSASRTFGITMRSVRRFSGCEITKDAVAQYHLDEATSWYTHRTVAKPLGKSLPVVAVYCFVLDSHPGRLSIFDQLPEVFLESPLWPIWKRGHVARRSRTQWANARDCCSRPTPRRTTPDRGQSGTTHGLGGRIGNATRRLPQRRGETYRSRHRRTHRGRHFARTGGVMKLTRVWIKGFKKCAGMRRLSSPRRH